MATAFDHHFTVPLCLTCHALAHAEPAELRPYFRRQLGADEYDRGYALSKTVARNLDYEKIRDGLRAELKKYGRG